MEKIGQSEWAVLMRCRLQLIGKVKNSSILPGTVIPDAANFANFKCGHYTAMIWRATTEIGAGKAIVQTGPRKGYVGIVGNYNPQGNKIGQDPTK
jgi:hypothetical protein